MVGPALASGYGEDVLDSQNGKAPTFPDVKTQIRSINVIIRELGTQVIYSRFGNFTQIAANDSLTYFWRS